MADVDAAGETSPDGVEPPRSIRPRSTALDGEHAPVSGWGFY